MYNSVSKRSFVTDRVRSTREGYVLTRVCLSVHTWGGTPARSRRGGGYPSQVQVGGYPSQVQAGGGGVPQPGPGKGGCPSQVQVGGPHLGYPPSDLAGGGLPQWGVPHLRYPPIRPGQGVPQWGIPQRGVPHLGYPPSDLARGVPHLRYPPSDLARGYPNGGYLTSGTAPSDLAGGYPDGGVPHRVVPDTPRSVCLLRSHRRTFLFLIILPFLTEIQPRVIIDC